MQTLLQDFGRDAAAQFSIGFHEIDIAVPHSRRPKNSPGRWNILLSKRFYIC